MLGFEMDRPKETNYVVGSKPFSPIMDETVDP